MKISLWNEVSALGYWLKHFGIKRSPVKQWNSIQKIKCENVQQCRWLSLKIWSQFVISECILQKNSMQEIKDKICVFFAKKNPYFSNWGDACNVFLSSDSQMLQIHFEFFCVRFYAKQRHSPTYHQSSLHFVRELRNLPSKLRVKVLNLRSILEENVNSSQSFWFIHVVIF